MAFLLRFDGVNDYVTLPSLVGGAFADRLDVNQGWTLEWQFKRSGSDTYIHRFFDNTGGSEGVLYRASDGLLRMTLLSGGPGDWTGVTTNTTDIATFRVVKTGGVNQYELFVDDGTGGGFVSYGTRSTAVQIFRFDVIGREGTTGYINGDLYYVDYSTTNSGANYFCDPSASGGTGSTLPDTVGSNDGTLINFPTDNSQWVFYSDATGITADVTESTANFSESSNISVTANITAQITESSSNFSESSSASFIGNISAQATEVNASFTESSSATITNNIVSVSVTETSQDFSESASASISGSLSAIVTELSQSFTESSTVDISANISAVITELAQNFNESAQVNLTSSFTVEVTETTSDFEEACYIQLPVIRLTPRKTISVSNRRSSTIRVRSRNNVIRVK